jgi:hypothetical protein
MPRQWPRSFTAASKKRSRGEMAAASGGCLVKEAARFVEPMKCLLVLAEKVLAGELIGAVGLKSCPL